MKIFTKSKSYSLLEIIDVCDKNGLITVDCLKDENMVSVEEYGDGELGGSCLFEFKRIKEDIFKLLWQETNTNLVLQKLR